MSLSPETQGIDEGRGTENQNVRKSNPTSDPEINGTSIENNEEEKTIKRNSGDLLRLVYELPSDFADNDWDKKKTESQKNSNNQINSEEYTIKLPASNDRISGTIISARTKLEERSNNMLSVTTHVSLKDVMNSNNALRLNRTARSELVDSDNVFLSDEEGDHNKNESSEGARIGFKNQTISVTECTKPDEIHNSVSSNNKTINILQNSAPKDIPPNNNTIERHSFSGSSSTMTIATRGMPLSPTSYNTGSNRNYSTSPIDCSNPLSDVSEDEVDALNKTLASNPDLLERWLRDKATPDVLRRVHAISEPPLVNSGSKRTSVTSELFQLWLASSPVKVRMIYL